MGEEDKKDPTWKPSELEPNVPTIVTLKSAKPAATGENKWGTWNLWPVTVEKQKVFEREGNKEVTDYTGDATCFPSAGLHEQFIKHTNGTQEDVKLEVVLVPKKGKKGYYTSFETKLVEGGATPPSNLLESHNRFLNDFNTFLKSKVVSNIKEDFVSFGKNDSYGISDETLDKLWIVHNERA